MGNKALSAIRYELKLARDRFDRAKTYANAVNLQSALRNFENWFKNERHSWFIWHNEVDPVPNPQHVPPTHFRVIEGGKKDI